MIKEVSIKGNLVINGEAFLEMNLDEISDKKFNNLLVNSKKVKVQLCGNGSNLIGTILGGSDPTRPLRSYGKKLKPKQNITILLDKELDKKMIKSINGSQAKLIINS